MLIVLSWFKDQTEGREASIAYALAGFVTAVCWILIIHTGDVVRSADEPDFLATAHNLATTGIFAVEPGQPDAYRAPGLVFFLTPFAAFGADLVEARLANAALVGLGLIMIFQLVRRHTSAFAGLLAVAMISVWPVVIYTSTTLYPQTLAGFMLVLTLWFLDGLRDGQWLKPLVFGGMAFGGLVLTIPIVLLVTPVFVLWIVYLSRKWFLAILIFGLVSGSMVGCWTLRNWLTFDTFIPVATSSGYNLLAGNTANARWNTSLNVRFPEYVYTEITGKSDAERNDIMTKAAFDEIAADPTRFAQRYLGKFLHWFHFSNQLMSDKVLEGGASSIPVGAREIILFSAWMALIVGPLLCRLFMIRHYPMKPLEALFLGLWIAAGLAYALFFTRVRFRLPFDWLVISTNAIFLSAVIENYLRSIRRR